MKRTDALLLVSLLFAPAASLAQIEARQATPEEVASPGTEADVEVPSPMLLEMSLGPRQDGKVQRKSLHEIPMGQTRTFWDTKKFVSDKARVRRVQVTKRQGKKKMIDLEVSPTLSTEWYRQDVDLTIALVADEKEIQRKTWDDLTIGSDDNAANKMGCMVCGASSSKTPKATFSLKQEDFDAMFADGKTPLVRVILAVEKGGDEDEEEEED